MSAASAAPTGDMLVHDALATSHGIAVFLSRRMYCVGCPVNKLHTLADAAREHRVALPDLLNALAMPAAR